MHVYVTLHLNSSLPLALIHRRPLICQKPRLSSPHSTTGPLISIRTLRAPRKSRPITIRTALKLQLRIGARVTPALGSRILIREVVPALDPVVCGCANTPLLAQSILLGVEEVLPALHAPIVLEYHHPPGHVLGAAGIGRADCGDGEGGTRSASDAEGDIEF